MLEVFRIREYQSRETVNLVSNAILIKQFFYFLKNRVMFQSFLFWQINS